MARKKSVRSASDHALIGASADLNENYLPTYLEVMKYFFFVRESLIAGGGGKEPSIHKIAALVAKKVCAIWQRASIPTASEGVVKVTLIRFHKWYRNIQKSLKKPGKLESEDVKKFKAKCAKLFDICTCKCEFLSKCKCKKEDKVPEKERQFLMNQRNRCDSKKLGIGGVDRKETTQLRKKARRQSKDSNTSKKSPQSKKARLNDSITSGTSESQEKDSSDSDFKPPRRLARGSSKQMRLPLPKLAAISIATGVSSRKVALIASAALVEAEVITDTDKSKVIDRSYIKRQKKKLLEKARKAEEKSTFFIEGLYFDGRKDLTVHFATEGKKTYQNKLMEEHVVLVQEPGSKYLGFVTPKSGNSANIKTAILEYLSKRQIDLSNFIVMGCDGTNVNVGSKGGIIRLMERHLNRPLQWSVCLLHGNELPLRHLIEHLDGKTKGPNTFSGPIGSILPKCHLLSVVNFTPIKNDLNLDIIDIKLLSNDQLYLLQISCAVSEGFCDEDVSRKTPGKIAHARWLTTASRILRLYVATEEPSDNLVSLVTFIQKVYTPVWFSVKINHSIQDGANNLWKMINFSRYLPETMKKIVDPVIQRNAFFAHPENILIGMIKDPRHEIRAEAWNKIREASRRKKVDTPRFFEVPKLNFQATEYIELVDWQSIEVTVPPILSSLPNEAIQKLVEENSIFEVSFPCHTQAVERCIKEVTEASLQVATAEERHLSIVQKMKFREKMAKYDTKSQFKL